MNEPHKQNELNRESLSALLDNEGDELELRRVLKNSASDREIVQLWSRYHTVRSVLRGCKTLLRPGFSDRVIARIQTEEFEPQPEIASSRFTIWQQNLARFAIAASVAMVAFLTLQSNPDNLSSPDATLLSSGNDAAGSSAVPNNATDSTTENVAANVQAYLERVYGNEEQEPVPIEHLRDSPLYRLVNETYTDADVNR